MFFICQNSIAQVRFCAVGDVLLDRNVRKIIEENDVLYPFEEVKDIILANDIAFYNNEFPFADSADGYAINKKYSFRAEPIFIEGLKYAGFNVASVANNHTIDYGKNGFLRTIQLLRENFIYPVGGGENQKQAFSPLLIEKNGQTFAIFANLEFLLEGTTFNPNRPYPAYAQIDTLCDVIKKYNNIVDFILVSFHWGKENAIFPTNRQVEFAHKVVNAGADLVFGHHPHVLQSIEIYRNKIILYSLGNFVFDNSELLQKQSVIFQCVFDNGKIENSELIPVFIQNNRPVPADKVQSELIFKHLTEVSEIFKTVLLKNNKKILIEYEHKPTVKEFVFNNLTFYFYSDSICVFDNDFFELTNNLPDTNYIFKDACMLPQDSMIFFYAIIENKLNNKSQIAIFEFSIEKYLFSRPFLDVHDFYNAWKIDILDVENDDKPDLIVGVKKSTRYFQEKENRIFVFNIEGTYIYPKWLGSKIGNPVIDFKINYDNNTLILLESFEKEGIYKAFDCKWNGFGFDLENFLFSIDTSQSIKVHFQLSDFEFITVEK